MTDPALPKFRLTANGGPHEHLIEVASPLQEVDFAQARQWERWIGRWRTSTFADALLQSHQQPSGYSLELAAGAFGAGAPSKLLYRMQRSGEPDLLRSIARGSAAGRWLESLPDPNGLAMEARCDPLWRLLAPTPMTPEELESLRRVNESRRLDPWDLPPASSGLWRKRWSVLCGTWIYRKPVDSGPRGQSWVRFVDIMIELRASLMDGHLPRYFQALHAAAEYWRVVRKASALARLDQVYVVKNKPLQFTLEDYLFCTFGCVAVDLSQSKWEECVERFAADGLWFKLGTQPRTHRAIMVNVDIGVGDDTVESVRARFEAALESCSTTESGTDPGNSPVSDWRPP